MSFEDRVKLLFAIADLCTRSDYCPQCFKKEGELYESKVICNVCGCLLGCSVMCAKKFSALHHAECDYLYPFKMFRCYSEKQLEIAVRGGEKEKVQVTAKSYKSLEVEGQASAEK